MFCGNSLTSPPSLRFEGMPETVLLNLEMEVHQSWLAFSKHAKHDLDNIRLSDLPTQDRLAGVQATFELEGLIVEGHCRDMPSGAPPRGLQLELLGSGTDYQVDSLVMANLGYVQLRAARPGIYDLRVRPGRSQDIFQLQSLGQNGLNSRPVNETGSMLAVASFDGLVIYPQFVRRSGKEEEDVLEESSNRMERPSLFNKLSINHRPHCVI